MLLPDKHILISESVLGVAARALFEVSTPKSYDSLVSSLGEPSVAWPSQVNGDSVSLALCLLYSMGLIDVKPNGDIVRCV